MDHDILHRFIVDLLIPPGSIVVALVFGMLIGKRWPRAGRAMLWSATVILYLVSTPVMSTFLTRLIGDYPPFETSARGNAGAIVILAAEQSDSPEFGGMTVGDLTLARVRLGAKLAHDTGLPILVTGGRFRPDDGASLAQLMQRTLSDEFHTPARWLEENSQDTRENAAESARILLAAHIDTVVLVTHYSHMRRSKALFEAQGLHVIAAPTSFPVKLSPLELGHFRPSFSALQDSALALHELIALAASALHA